MTVIRIEEFRGLAPKIEKMKLPESAAQVAENVRLESGSIRGLRASPLISPTVSVPAAQEGVFHLKDGTTRHWFPTSEVVTGAADSFTPDDAYKRYFITDNTWPKRYRWNGSWSDQKLGLPIPPPITGVTGAVPAHDPTDLSEAPYLQYVSYVCSWVSTIGEEGPLSVPSTSVWRKDGDSITITLPALPNNGYDQATGALIRIYRLNLSTSNTGDYQYVAQVAHTQAGLTYVDTVDNGDLQEVAINQNWFMPPNDDNQSGAITGNITSEERVFNEGPLQGITLLATGGYVGYAGKSLHLSVVGVPTAWPWEYIKATTANILGIVPTTEGALVITDGYPFLLAGSDPSNSILARIPSGYACSSRKSIVDMGGFCIYASQDGLVMGTGMDISIPTRQFMTREDWVRYDPATLQGARWGDKYLGLWDDTGTIKGFVFDPKGEDYYFVEVVFAEAVAFAKYNTWRDVLELYNPSNDARDFCEDTTAIACTWQSKLYYSQRPICFSAIKIDADRSVWASGGITVTVEAGMDGEVVTDSFTMTQSFGTTGVERLNITDNYNVWSVKVAFNDSTGGAVHSVSLAEAMGEF